MLDTRSLVKLKSFSTAKETAKGVSRMGENLFRLAIYLT